MTLSRTRLVVHDPKSKLLIPVVNRSDQVLAQFALNHNLTPESFEELRNLIEGRCRNFDPAQVTMTALDYNEKILSYSSRLCIRPVKNRYSSDSAHVVVDLVVQ